MAKVNCSACDSLREDAPNFVVNGLGTTECNSLKNDTGLNPSSGNNDCTDLENMNDCLIGNMESEIELYDVCDWKDYMRKFVQNAWTMFKGIICAICGIWTNIKNMLARLKKLECLVDFLYQGATFNFGEYSNTGNSYIVAGKGVSFSNVDASGTSADLYMIYIAGGLCRMGGSCLFYKDDFTDRIKTFNFDNGTDIRQTTSRKGNPIWDSHDTKPGGASSELVYEIRLKKEEFPQIKSIQAGLALNNVGGGFHGVFASYNEGSYAPGQHGNCDSYTGRGTQESYDDGHLVPSGWIYIQCRITWIERITANPSQYSPTGYVGIRMNQDKIEC